MVRERVTNESPHRVGGTVEARANTDYQRSKTSLLWPISFQCAKTIMKVSFGFSSYRMSIPI